MLAGELRDCGGDYGAAFARYEQRLMPFLKRKQLSSAKSASSIAPKTAFGIRFRNLVVRLMRLPFVVDYFIGRQLRDQVQLPVYGSFSAAWIVCVMAGPWRIWSTAKMISWRWPCDEMSTRPRSPLSTKGMARIVFRALPCAPRVGDT